MSFEAVLYLAALAAPALLIAGAALFFAFRRPAPREERLGSPAATAFLALAGVLFILVGAAACVVAPFFFALHGFQWDSGTERFNGVAGGFLALFIGIVLLVTGVIIIRTWRRPL